MGTNQKLTPLMQQYWDVKSAHPDKILFFRMGDFYELFYDDAITVTPILGIALTSRNKNSGDETPMCGMPHHSASGYINKLLAHNFKVAICDQVEDPKIAKGIVKRAVTRILSPGMVLDPDTLDHQRTNYLASYDQRTVSFLEPTTGEAFYYLYSDSKDLNKLLDLIRPVELVLTKQQKAQYLEGKKSLEGPHLTEFEKDVNSLVSQGTDVKPDVASTSASKKSNNEQNVPFLLKSPESARRLVAYAVVMQGPEILKTVLNFEERMLVKRLELSKNVVRHLELFETYRGEVKNSFFSAIDRTKTSAGARKLKNWILFPLTDIAAIEARYNEIEKWISQPNELKDLRKIFGQMGDIERRLGKISNPSCNARDLVALARSLQAGLDISQLTGLAYDKTTSPMEAGQPTNAFKSTYDLVQKILNTITDEPPVATREGGMIREKISPELDELIALTTDSQSRLLQMEEREKSATGISSLKIRYNNVFGYYIEITKTHAAKAPTHYMRKQTLANAERFITPELQELENKILSARTKRSDVEYEIFSDLRKVILNHAASLLKQSHAWSELDVLTSFAWLAIENNYSRPRFSSSKLESVDVTVGYASGSSKISASVASGDSVVKNFLENELSICSSRHPVIEQMVPRFVANDILIQPRGCMLLTGPNMAGKSTLMRQVALTVLLAQMGSFVPAKPGTVLPIFDRIFTRIGASDFLTEGFSTFMVEMIEAAEILNDATANSLVILDEIGRGTSTYDGMSLAQAILEHLVGQVKCMTLFATHYHELTELDRSFPQVQNHHMKIVERNGQIEFIHTLASGPANKSYGIEVARRAGLPTPVLKRAQKILDKTEFLPQQQLSLLNFDFTDSVTEKNHSDLTQKNRADSSTQELVGDLTDLSFSQNDLNSQSEQSLDYSQSLAEYDPQELKTLLSELKAASVGDMTPLEALNRIAKWQERLS